MEDTWIDETRRTIIDELGVLSDDVRVTQNGDALTFYLPVNQLDKAENIIKEEVEVLEEYEHEYLVKTCLKPD